MKWAKETADRARCVVENAKTAIRAYLNKKRPTLAERAKVAGHAIRLAKLDDVYRAIRLDPSFEEASEEDVGDLLALLAIVPFKLLLHDEVLRLNPTFGEASNLVGGADSDLISGDLLIDFKTTMKSSMSAPWLDQLFGYFLLARHEHNVDPKFPEIKRVAFYFSRHGLLWELDPAIWTDHPKFAKVEKWFFKRARQIFGVPRVRPVNRN